MRIRVLGGGWYGCHIACALIADGHDVQLHESADRLFAGASGAIPARHHLGFHYPRSRLTRTACLAHSRAFMTLYGDLTHGVPVNIYAVALNDSLVDFGTYAQVLRGEVEFITIERPDEYGLRNVEGALLTGERHVVTDRARRYFETRLKGHVRYRALPGEVDDARWGLTIDCTFCALDAENVDHYEPCLTVLLEGPTERAVTIMDGPFPSLYPWDETQGLSSLTSASLTPLARVATWAEARAVLDTLHPLDLKERAEAMIDQMAGFWPACRDLYRIADFRLAVRAMPRSAADARLVDVIKIGARAVRVRASKIDAVLAAESAILAWLPDFARLAA